MARNQSRTRDAATITEPVPDSKNNLAVPASVAEPPPVGGPKAKPAPPLIHIDVICGGITNVKVPVAVGPRYAGLPLAGPAKAFDRLLDSWLTRALDLGMIGSDLGQIFPLNLQRKREAGKINVDHLLLVGMGAPGRFAADDLRYLMSNVTVAVKSLTLDKDVHRMSTMLIGTRRRELPIADAVRGFLEGIRDGYVRFRAIADVVKERPEQFRQAAEQSLSVALVEADRDRAESIFKALKVLERSVPDLHLEVDRGEDAKEEPEAPDQSEDTDPEIPVTLLQVTRAPTSPSANEMANSTGVAGTDVFQLSALTDAAAVTVREMEVNPYFVRELPDRVAKASDPTEQMDFGLFFDNYLIHDDLRELIEKASNLTFVVDDVAAGLPWEMAAYRRYGKTTVLGTSKRLSRLFHSLLSPPPRSLPPLNRILKALIIADPATGQLSLPGARAEGFAVVGVLDQARQAWNGEYQFEVHVRIGSYRDDEDPILKKIRQRGNWIVSVERCDPMKIAMLIVNEHFDVIHYAGHGAFDPNAKRAGWVLDQECFLTAHEIFRVRQVPRLVFANACFSAVTSHVQADPRGQLVGLAQAFFARGIPNYIGTGWAVADECASECARWFYALVLGLNSPSGEVIGTSPPATIGDALLVARQKAFESDKSSSTWGAYQHYGRLGDKLLPFPNAPQSPPV
jgi:hypothetical protein